jgi:hypothetical protein
MTIKAKLAGAMFAVLTIAAPLALTTTPAAAAPHGGGYHHPDAMHDRDHRPPMRVEHRSRQPHGHYKWREGRWNWSHDHWIWMPGIWIRF